MSASHRPSTKRRWFRLSLRTLLIWTTIISIVLGRIGNIAVRVRQQRQIIAQIETLGGRCGFTDSASEQHRPSILGIAFGDDAIPKVNSVFWRNDAVQDSDLALLRAFRELTQLELHGRGITNEGLRHLQRSKHLRMLTLSDTMVTGRGIASLDAATSIEFLTLEGSTTNDLTLEGIGELSSLRHLVLRGRGLITESGFSNLKDLSSLESLFVYIPLTDPSLRYLTDLPNLKALELARSDTGDAAVEHIKKIKTVVRLGINRTQLTDAALGELCKEMEQLQQLSIMFTQVTDSGIQELSQLYELKRLAIGPGVSMSAATELARSLPSCQINVWDGSKYSEIKPAQ